MSSLRSSATSSAHPSHACRLPLQSPPPPPTPPVTAADPAPAKQRGGQHLYIIDSSENCSRPLQLPGGSGLQLVGLHIPNGLPQLLHPLTSEFPATRIKRAPLVLIRAPRSLPPGGTTPCGCFLTIPFGGWQILISAETSCSLSGYTPAKIQKCGTARPFHIRTKISRWRLQVPQTAPVCDVRSRHCDG